MGEICMSGSMSGVWKQSHGRASEAPPNERGGNRYVRPTATAPHLDSTLSGHSLALLDDLVCPREDRGRHREAKVFRGLEVDDEIELHRLLDRQIAGLGT